MEPGWTSPFLGTRHFPQGPVRTTPPGQTPTRPPYYRTHVAFFRTCGRYVRPLRPTGAPACQAMLLKQVFAGAGPSVAHGSAPRVSLPSQRTPLGTQTTRTAAYMQPGQRP